MLLANHKIKTSKVWFFKPNQLLKPLKVFICSYLFHFGRKNNYYLYTFSYIYFKIETYKN